MLRHRLFSIALTSSFVLAACQLPPGEATLQVRPELASAMRQVLATGYTAADIHHLDIRLSRVEGGLPSLISEAEVPGTALGSTLTFGNLRMNSAYVIAAVAYADEAETQVISEAATSKVDLVVGQSPTVTPVTVPVKLKSQVTTVPGADASTTLEVQQGAWITPAPTPTPTPTPTPASTPTPTTSINATFVWQEFDGGPSTMAIEDVTGGVFSTDQMTSIDLSRRFTIPSFSRPYNTSHTFRVWWVGSDTSTYKSMPDSRIGDVTATVGADGSVSWTYQDYPGNNFVDTLVLQ